MNEFTGTAAQSANLAIVRSICKRWQRGDYSSAAWADPEIEFVIAGGPEPGIWTGLERMRQRAADGLRPWRDLHVEADEIRELEDEHVLVIVRLKGRGKVSGLDVERLQAKGACIFQLQGGKVIRLAYYFDCSQAVADLGFASNGDRRAALRRCACPLADDAVPRPSTRSIGFPVA